MMSDDVVTEDQSSVNIQIMGISVYNAMMGCIASSTETETRMQKLADILAQPLASGQVVTYKMLDTSYWLEAFIRSTPIAGDIVRVEHAITKHIKNKDNLLYTL
jgi:hypothetical protein